MAKLDKGENKMTETQIIVLVLGVQFIQALLFITVLWLIQRWDSKINV